MDKDDITRVKLVEVASDASIDPVQTQAPLTIGCQLGSQRGVCSSQDAHVLDKKKLNASLLQWERHLCT